MSCSACLLRVGGLQELIRHDMAEYGASSGSGNRMRVVREPVQKCTGPGGDCGDDFLAGDDGAKRSVSAGQALGGDENVRRDVPMIDSKIDSGSAHAGHDFIGDQEHT